MKIKTTKKINLALLLTLIFNSYSDASEINYLKYYYSDNYKSNAEDKIYYQGNFSKSNYYNIFKEEENISVVKKDYPVYSFKVFNENTEEFYKFKRLKDNYQFLSQKEEVVEKDIEDFFVNNKKSSFYKINESGLSIEKKVNNLDKIGISYKISKGMNFNYLKKDKEGKIYSVSFSNKEEKVNLFISHDFKNNLKGILFSPQTQSINLEVGLNFLLFGSSLNKKEELVSTLLKNNEPLFNSVNKKYLNNNFNIGMGFYSNLNKKDKFNLGLRFDYLNSPVFNYKYIKNNILVDGEYKRFSSVNLFGSYYIDKNEEILLDLDLIETNNILEQKKQKVSLGFRKTYGNLTCETSVIKNFLEYKYNYLDLSLKYKGLSAEVVTNGETSRKKDFMMKWVLSFEKDF